jgi:hypothetical protein
MPADLVDELLGRVVTSISLLLDWRDRLLGRLTALLPAALTHAARQAATSRKLARITQSLIDGDLSQADYRTEMTRLEGELE